MVFYDFDKLLKTKKNRLRNLMLLLKKATGSNIKFFLVQNPKIVYVGIKPKKIFMLLQNEAEIDRQVIEKHPR